jgi:hypothetical protein
LFGGSHCRRNCAGGSSSAPRQPALSRGDRPGPHRKRGAGARGLKLANATDDRRPKFRSTSRAFCSPGSIGCARARALSRRPP